ncbi:hypothetical protein NHX12_029184 [Muraenolepis orangiensis]|uniref:non-specific serine/threonine protein kinase n=1 Tax=Muraenolepis orangiensis TaxID=630683 RepID=A0A9Q0EBQ1_9TELE|nr:hypothetical protein NHX12_029184 [Muraenolepis orangiensis]
MSEEMVKGGEENLSHSQAQTQSPPTPSQAHSQAGSGSGSGTGSGSSSGPTSASQSSGTMSSVDTIPVPLASVPEEPEPQPWGRLLPMERGFRALNCVEDAYLFGRDSKCDYVIGDPLLQSVRIYSKKHFRLFREGDIVFVEDLSNNGTFVDGTLVGKGRKHPLVNNSTSFPKEFQEKYLVSRGIGTGVCGEVKLAFERSTCKKVAVKIINKKNFPSVGTATRNAEREIEILRRIDHPCLIKTEDFYQTEDTYYIILELMEGGELFNRVKSGNGLDEAVAKLYFYQMLRAVEYLHRNGIIHRDLKPENILLASHENICLIKVHTHTYTRVYIYIYTYIHTHTHLFQCCPGYRFQPVQDSGGGDSVQDPVWDPVLPGPGGVHPGRYYGVRPLCGRLESGGPAVCLPRWLRSISRASLPALHTGADHPGDVQHDSYQMERSLRPSQGYGEEVVGGRPRSQTVNCVGVGASMVTGPRDVGPGQQSDVPSSRH